MGQVQSLLRAGLKLAGQISNRARGQYPRIGVPLLGHQLQGVLRLGLGSVITQHRLVERAGKSLGGGRRNHHSAAHLIQRQATQIHAVKGDSIGVVETAQAHGQGGANLGGGGHQRS